MKNDAGVALALLLLVSSVLEAIALVDEMSIARKDSSHR